MNAGYVTMAFLGQPLGKFLFERTSVDDGKQRDTTHQCQKILKVSLFSNPNRQSQRNPTVRCDPWISIGAFVRLSARRDAREATAAAKSYLFTASVTKIILMASPVPISSVSSFLSSL